MPKAGDVICKKGGDAQNSAYVYWGYVPSIRKPRHAQMACFGARMDYQRAHLGTLVVFGRGNVGRHENAPHMGHVFVSGWREGGRTWWKECSQTRKHVPFGDAFSCLAAFGPHQTPTTCPFGHVVGVWWYFLPPNFKHQSTPSGRVLVFEWRGHNPNIHMRCFGHPLRFCK